MQHTVSIMIPDRLEPYIQHITNFESFVSRITIHALQRQDAQIKHSQLAKAAQLMLQDYSNDEELTSFTALDGEPVL